MSSPACASGSAATPPTAPSPTMTTSVFFSSVAIVPTVVIPRRARGASSLEHPVLVGGHVGRSGARVELLLRGGHGKSDTRVTNQIPSHKVRVAPVVGITEGALDGVS